MFPKTDIFRLIKHTVISQNDSFCIKKSQRWVNFSLFLLQSNKVWHYQLSKEVSLQYNILALGFLCPILENLTLVLFTSHILILNLNIKAKAYIEYFLQRYYFSLEEFDMLSISQIFGILVILKLEKCQPKEFID